MVTTSHATGLEKTLLGGRVHRAVGRGGGLQWEDCQGERSGWEVLWFRSQPLGDSARLMPQVAATIGADRLHDVPLKNDKPHIPLEMGFALATQRK